MSTKSVAELCREQQLTLKQLVEQSGVDEHRIVAILMGRWTYKTKGVEWLYMVIE